MKLSKKPTGWLMVKAFTGSEWDSVDFMLLDISSKTFNNYLREMIDKAEAFKDDMSFYCLSHWSDNADWYIFSYEEDGYVETPKLEDGWSYVDLTVDELNKLKRPEQWMRGGLIKTFSNGDIQFTTNGKHTDEEFWSERIPMEQILNDIP